MSVAVTGLLVAAPKARAQEALAAECPIAPAHGAPRLTVGHVDCLRIDARQTLGGLEPLSYYIPPACAPAKRRKCPVLYYLHGTGGTYREALGTKGTRSSVWVKALTQGPRVDPHDVADPWTLQPAGWVPKPALDLIIVVPHGRSLPGGFGPGAAGVNGFWMDWNPRYAKGGDTPRYDTPPPRWETFLVDGLVPFVDKTFPAIRDRIGRAITGVSMGGIGSLPNGLRHPDVWSFVGMISGGVWPFVTATDVEVHPSVGIAPPVALGKVPLPGAVPTVIPEALWSQDVAYGYAAVLSVGFGDQVADQAWWRYSLATDLVTNARAFAGHRQSVTVDYFNNDMVPRVAEDFADPDYPSSQAFETLLTPTATYLDTVFTRNGVEHRYEIHPGIHTGRYWNPYLRGYLAAMITNLDHGDGNGAGRPLPDRFDYRTIRPDFTIWGWHVAVTRSTVEFLNLTNVSCHGLTVQGSGVVTITPPPACAHAPVKVDLGPSQATDEPMGAGSTPFYGTTRTVTLRKRASD